jgi:phospholipid-binding lipoprotein MlaA
MMLLLTSCASGTHEPNDPLEPVNRAVFAFNQVVDGLVLEPAAELYGLVTPRPVRTAVRNLLDHLASPVVLANDLLQGERERAGVTLARFMINSTLGAFGLYDMAANFGYLRHSEDFGQTLAVWGVDEGPYLVLPLLGPSNPRDAVGRVVDLLLLDPNTWLLPQSARLTRTATDAVATRFELDPVLDDLERSSLDVYAALRASYSQRRQSEIRNGAPPPLDSPAYQEVFGDDPLFDPEAE